MCGDRGCVCGIFAGDMHRWQFVQKTGGPGMTAAGAMFGDCPKVEML